MKNITLETLKNLFPFNTVNVYPLECGYNVGSVDELLNDDPENLPIFIRNTFEIDHFANFENKIIAYVR